jgi:gamma-glutamylcyclotransferase (GGCT)/AIG2-like uncharacterized protein YtfP
VKQAPLFVYGTLRRGECNHRELRGSVFLGFARTTPRYAVRRIAGFPALLPGTNEVSGELYEVDGDLLARLDRFEGDAYRRRLVDLTGGASAQAYFLADSAANADEV